MNRTARHTRPIPVAEFQATVHLSAGGACLARCIPATDAYQVDAFPTALVLKDGIEPTYACICDAIGEVMIPEHTSHIQVLNTNGAHLAVVRQLMSDLVNVIKSLIGDLDMYACDMMLNLLPSGRSFCLVSKFPLVMLQTLFSRLGKMRSREFTTIGADCKGLYTCVDANGCACVNSRAGLLGNGCVNKNGSVVLPVRIHRDGYVLDLAVEASVKNDRDILALRNAESLVPPVDTTVLRVVKGLSVLLAFEQRMSSSMLPPVFESICDLLDGILQRLRVDLAKPRVYFLQCDKLSLGSIVAYAYSATAPHHGHIIQRTVVCHAAAAEALGEELRLIRSRIDSVFVRSQHYTNSFYA